MAIDVTVKQQCSRCKREVELTISSDELAEFEAQVSKGSEQEQAIRNFVEANDMPDLVVIFKGEVQVFSEVCAAHCEKPVTNSIGNIFREPKPRGRKASAANGKKADTKKADTKKAKKKDAQPAAAAAE